MSRLPVLSTLLILLLTCAPVLARQEPAAIVQAVEGFLQQQTQDLPGEVSFDITPPGPRNQLAPCSALSVSLPAGARLWGRSTVIVSCLAERGWKIHVPVHIRVQGNYLVTTRPVALGQVLEATDLSLVTGELSNLPNDLLTRTDQAIGHSAAQSLAAGRPLRGHMLRSTAVIQQGQQVQVLLKGPGFQVTRGDGRALAPAAAGQLSQVRLPNGHIVSGIARADGVVEVSY